MTIAIDRRALFAGAAGLLAAGCSDIIGPPPAFKLYMLAPKLPGGLAGGKVGWALALRAPEAIAGLDGERIAILFPPAHLDYYADAAWADRLPNLVDAALLEAFESSGRIDAVARDADAVRSDYTLSVDLRDFESRLDSGETAPLAVVRISVRVLKSRSHEIVGYKSFSREERAAVNTVEAGVAALNSAFGGVLGELDPWVLDRPSPD